MGKGQWEPAEREFETALKLRRTTLGDHPLVANTMVSLSHVMRKLKRKKEAKRYEAQATEILSSQRDPVYSGINTIDVRAFHASNR
jgi:hypothetical protein